MLSLKVIKKVKKLFRLILLIIFLIFIFTIILNIYTKPKISNNASTNLNSVNIISEENLVKEFKNVNKIIPLEVGLSKTITIDKSFGSLDIFKKYKEIQFFANCSYYIDLSTLNINDITLDNFNNIIEIKVPYPEIFNISILRDKTIYSNSSNGLLRFGEIKLTQEEFDLIQNEVYKSFEETLKNDDLYNEAIENSKISITTLLNKLTNKDVKIKISFK